MSIFQQYPKTSLCGKEKENGREQHNSIIQPKAHKQSCKCVLEHTVVRQNLTVSLCKCQPLGDVLIIKHLTQSAWDDVEWTGMR